MVPLDLKGRFSEDPIEGEVAPCDDGEEVDKEPTDFDLEARTTVEFVEGDLGVVAHAGRVASAIDQHHRDVLDWIVGIHVDSAVKV